jgi:preprotein translocase subunit SecE
MSITSYFKEVRAEMKHVSWPGRRMVIMYTAVVIGISLGVAIYLGLLDYIFAAVIKKII